MLSSFSANGHGIPVLYSESHWRQLRSIRTEALRMMRPLNNAALNPIVYGSVARGDVTLSSDIDVFVPTVYSSFSLECAIEDGGFIPLRRVIIQATPRYAPKGYIYVDENRTFSFPLTGLRVHEREFYIFGGELSFDQLKREERVLGVDKSLTLIEPTEEGHVETGVTGREEEVASLLRIDVRTVRDRVRALSRRDEIGRTGVFLKRELSSDETFELVLKRLSDSIPAVRRRIRNGKSP